MKKITIMLMAMALVATLVGGAALAQAANLPPVVESVSVLPDDDLAAPGVQIDPNPGTTKNAEVWVVASDPDGVADIKGARVEVTYPDGSLKCQVDAVERTVAEAAAAGLGTLNSTMVKVFSAACPLEYFDTPGGYGVAAWATDQSDADSGVADAAFTYNGIVAYEIDFTNIDYGEIKRGKTSIVYGDLNMATPLNPTIHNIGNEPLLLGLEPTVMVGDTTAAELRNYDAGFLGEELDFEAGDIVSFMNPLEADLTAAIDFSLHTPHSATLDSYRGTMYVSAQKWQPAGVTVISLIPCDGGYCERNEFYPGQDVYVQASGLNFGEYKIWLQPDPVIGGQVLDPSADPSGAQEIVTVGMDGILDVTLIWQIPAGAAATYTKYDIIINKTGPGENIYSGSSDGIDAIGIAGITAPIPELQTIILLGMGFLALAGFFVLRRHREGSLFGGQRA